MENASNLGRLLSELNEFGLKDGDIVYIKSWTPKKGYYWSKKKLEYNHPIYGVYPNLTGYMEASRACVLHNNFFMKKSRNSKSIFNFKF